MVANDVLGLFPGPDPHFSCWADVPTTRDRTTSNWFMVSRQHQRWTFSKTLGAVPRPMPLLHKRLTPEKRPRDIDRVRSSIEKMLGAVQRPILSRRALLLLLWTATVLQCGHAYSFQTPTRLRRSTFRSGFVWHSNPHPADFLRATANGKETTEEEIESEVSSAERTTGLLVLATIPLAWGTFEPAFRYVYAIEPPIPGFVFSLSFYLVAAVSLLSAALLFDNLGDEGRKSDWPVLGGLELGFYLFLGNAFQALGLKTIPSDNAAFLLQLTTIFVPLLDALIARNLFKVSIRTWMACFVALAGVGIMGLDGQDSAKMEPSLSLLTDSLSQFGAGEAFIVAAAVVYTFHCIRLEGYAKKTSAVKLAASKATTETSLTALAVAAFVLSYQSSGAIESQGLSSFGPETGQEIVTFFSSFKEGIANGSMTISTLLPAIFAILWTGWITCAYTIYAQSFGQSRVPPVTANLIYTAQPICTALFAWALLGETLGPAGYAGGFLIGFAVLLVVLNGNEQKSTWL